MALKKKKTTKSESTGTAVKKARTKTSAKKAKTKSVGIKKTTKTTVRRSTTSSTKTGSKAGRTTKRKAPKSKQSIHRENISMEAKIKSSSTKNTAASLASAPPGLLIHTKSSASALNRLEKGIELLHKKDYKKALNEFKSLCQSYPAETEILARTRSYILICEREAASGKKAETNADQLYALGVLEHNNKNYEEAIELYTRSLKNNPDVDYIHYSIAASHAMKGELKASLQSLRKAVELNEDSRIFARNDADFSAFEDSEEFAELVGIDQDSANGADKQ